MRNQCFPDKYISLCQQTFWALTTKSRLHLGSAVTTQLADPGGEPRGPAPPPHPFFFADNKHLLKCPLVTTIGPPLSGNRKSAPAYTLHIYCVSAHSCHGRDFVWDNRMTKKVRVVQFTDKISLFCVI